MAWSELSPRDYSRAWLRVILRFHKAGTFITLLPTLIALTLFTTLVVYIDLYVIEHELNIPTSMHSMVGIVLGLLLVFRTNTAYDRWWEARKLYGALVNNCRNLANKVHCILPADDIENRQFFNIMISNFCYSMTDHLRYGIDVDKLADVGSVKVNELNKEVHVPNLFARRIYNRIIHLREQGVITDFDFLALDKQAEALVDILGGCERIKKTPIPYAYSIHLKKFITLYVSTLPFGFLGEFHWFTIPAVLIVFYGMVGIEIIGEEIEDPFGKDKNDLPIWEISKGIAANVNETFFGDTELPLVKQTRISKDHLS